MKQPEIIIPRIVVRRRRPPRPRIGARVSAHYMRWELGRYRERLTAGPGGIGRRGIWTPERAAEQHNMVLDNAFDVLVAQHGMRELNRYAAVGTGSTTPAADQTGLEAELARTGNVPGGESDTVTRVADGVYEVRRVREFTEAQVGNHNLTEWGWSPESGVGNNLMSRELFRDGGGNAVTVSLTEDQKLRLIYVVRIAISPVSAVAHTMSVTDLGDLTGQFVVTRGNANLNWHASDIDLIEALATGSNLPYAILHTAAVDTAYDAGSFAQAVRVGISLQSYTAGSRSRSTNQILYDTGVTGTFWTIGLGWYEGAYNTMTQTPVRFVLDSSFDKDNIHKLILDPWVLSWGP